MVYYLAEGVATGEADGLSGNTVEFVAANGTQEKFSPLWGLNWHSFKQIFSSFPTLDRGLYYHSFTTLSSERQMEQFSGPSATGDHLLIMQH